MIASRMNRPVCPAGRLVGLLFALLGIVILASSAAAVSPRAIEGPVGPVLLAQKALEVPAVETGFTDIDRALAEDIERTAAGLVPRFALAEKAALTPDNAGEWLQLDDEMLLWRLRVAAPGAVSLNFEFSEFRLPKNSRLSLYPADWQGLDDPRGVRVLDEMDNRADGTLWTPLVQADEVIVELLVPQSEVGACDLAISSINRGYRFFGREAAEKQGYCNIDVVCPEGDGWWDEINSVALITIDGMYYCSGALVNNTAQDETPYFLTAEHCTIDASNDHTVVAYWNFQSASCGDLAGGSLAEYTTGTTFLGAQVSSDVALVRLDEAPPLEFGVTYSGWDRSGDVPTSAVTVHHPSGDEKAISFENDPLSITSYYSSVSPGDGTHLRVEDWDLGTTEGGSSGGPLYDANHRIVGQLHGGDAACGNDSPDWYGRFSVSWPVLESYLDPLATGAMTLDTYVPGFTGISVTPTGEATASGETGGPFTPDAFVYTVMNRGNTALDYAAGADVDWVTVVGGGGTLPGSGTAEVEIVLNAQADLLAPGEYTGTIQFVNLTDGEGDTSRTVRLAVGEKTMTIAFPLDVDPGWDAEGLWAFGEPSGGGGEHGAPDPTAGYTGANVLGYNLDGDYENDLPATHLTSAPLDCSQLSGAVVRFRRWLGVERSAYDRATFSVSADGSNWTTVWENSAEVNDGEWILVEYDISAVADGEASVRLRWTMGPTDDSWPYCGWNLDDIEIQGVLAYMAPAPPVAVAAGALTCSPNPFNPVTTLRFEMARAGAAYLAVYDVQGRLVRTLHDGALPAGPSRFVFDGRDDAGGSLGSGVYFAWLRSGDGNVCRKMVLLK